MKTGTKKAGGDVAAAQSALARYWGTRGDEGMAEAAEALRSLSPEQLKMVGAWIPHGNPGSSTAVKCDRARAIVLGVLEEKR